jgi:hypothetical protein
VFEVRERRPTANRNLNNMIFLTSNAAWFELIVAMTKQP